MAKRRILLLVAALVVCEAAKSVVPANVTLAAAPLAAKIEPPAVGAANPVPPAATPAPNPVAATGGAAAPANVALAAAPLAAKIEPLSVRAADPVPPAATPAPNPAAADPKVAAAPVDAAPAALAAALASALPAPSIAAPDDTQVQANPAVPADETLPAGPPASASAVTYDEVHAPAHEHPLLAAFNPAYQIDSHSAFDRTPVAGLDEVVFGIRTSQASSHTTVPAIVRAWAGRAKHVLFFSDADDTVMGHKIESLREPGAPLGPPAKAPQEKFRHEKKEKMFPDSLDMHEGWRPEFTVSAFVRMREQFAHAKWFVLVDDNTHVFLEPFAAMLALPHRKSGPRYMGNAVLFWAHGCERGRHVRMADTGAGIILNKEAIDASAEQMKVSKYIGCPIGEARLALVLADAGISVETVPGIFQNSLMAGSLPTALCETPLTFHMMSPQQFDVAVLLESPSRPSYNRGCRDVTYGDVLHARMGAQVVKHTLDNGKVTHVAGYDVLGARTRLCACTPREGEAGQKPLNPWADGFMSADVKSLRASMLAGALIHHDGHNSSSPRSAGGEKGNHTRGGHQGHIFGSMGNKTHWGGNHSAFVNATLHARKVNATRGKGGRGGRRFVNGSNVSDDGMINDAADKIKHSKTMEGLRKRYMPRMSMDMVISAAIGSWLTFMMMFFFMRLSRIESRGKRKS